MTGEQARALVGNQSTHSLQNMIAALRMLPWLNTPEDLQRLAAAKLIVSERKHNARRQA